MKWKKLGKYPSNDMLNNALRFLLSDEPKIDLAINEIVFAIQKADGILFDDVKVLLDKHIKENKHNEFTH